MTSNNVIITDVNAIYNLYILGTIDMITTLNHHRHALCEGYFISIYHTQDGYLKQIQLMNNEIQELIEKSANIFEASVSEALVVSEMFSLQQLQEVRRLYFFRFTMHVVQILYQLILWKIFTKSYCIQIMAQPKLRNSICPRLLYLQPG